MDTTYVLYFKVELCSSLYLKYKKVLNYVFRFTGGGIITEGTCKAFRLRSCYKHDPPPAQVGQQD